MGLIEKIVGRTDEGRTVHNRITPPLFDALAGEFSRGKLTVQGIQDILSVCAVQLTADELTEAQALLLSVTSLLTAVAQLARAREIDDVLFLGRLGAPGYRTPSDVRTRLGL